MIYNSTKIHKKNNNLQKKSKILFFDILNLKTRKKTNVKPKQITIYNFQLNEIRIF